jgi:hypothetical protein
MKKGNFLIQKKFDISNDVIKQKLPEYHSLVDKHLMPYFYYNS